MGHYAAYLPESGKLFQSPFFVLAVFSDTWAKPAAAAHECKPVK